MNSNLTNDSDVSECVAEKERDGWKPKNILHHVGIGGYPVVVSGTEFYLREKWGHDERTRKTNNTILRKEDEHRNGERKEVREDEEQKKKSSKRINVFVGIIFSKENVSSILFEGWIVFS